MRGEVYPDFYRLGHHSRSRLVEAAAGAWLYASGFLWPHTRTEFLLAAITGGAVFLFAMLAWWRVAPLRWANLTLAIGLFCSVVFGAWSSEATASNHLLVSMLVLVTAFFPALRVPFLDPPLPARR